MNKGTPKTLGEVAERIVCFNHGQNIREITVSIIRDYMAQKFGAALLKYKDEKTQKALKEIWAELTGEVLK